MTVWCVGVLAWTLVLRRPGAGEHVQSVLVCSIIGKMWSSLRLQSHARTFVEHVYNISVVKLPAEPVPTKIVDSNLDALRG